MNNAPAHNSKLQHFLWLVSGSEISILKRCPTDYNRHAGIGFTILMTCLFGAFAGGYAGFYFTRSYVGACVFGIIWGLLIFSIDRTMVVSLKKKPDSKWSDYVPQIIMRAILALLIAFIISIPLELLVFKDNIDAGLSPYKQDKEIKLSQLLDSLYKPGRDFANSIKAKAESDSLYRMSKFDPPDPQFRQILNDWNKLNTEINYLKQQQRPYANYQSLYQIAANFQKILAIDPNSIGAQDSLNQYKQEAADHKQQFDLIEKTLLPIKADLILKQKMLDSLKHQYSEEMIKKGAIMDTVSTNLSNTGKTKDTVINSTNQKFKNDLAKMDSSFSVRFDVLAFLADKRNAGGEREYPSVFFLLWLIRILFFVIEILPSVSKIATPFGAYDMVIYDEEKNLKEVKLPEARRILENEIFQDEAIQLEEKRRQAKFRVEKEQVLHDKIVERIVDSQDKIANKIISDWEQKNLI